ncbi:MAG: hypothetical protein AB8U25_06020 [Rickettsiales endosymbiont of Dermacentor nuttalli]
MAKTKTTTSIKEFRPEQWRQSIASLEKEVRPIYESIIKALIENHSLTHYQHKSILEGKKIHGIRIVHSENNKPDIVFGKSNTAFLRLYLSQNTIKELGILEFNSEQIDTFANIYAGIIDTRINSKQAHKLVNNKKKYGLDIINEEKLAKTAASIITKEHYNKINNLNCIELFNLGKQIASPQKTTLIEPYINQKHTEQLLEAKIKTIVSIFNLLITQK